MDLIQKELLEEIAGLHEVPAGAYNIRANGKAAARNTTANIDIVSKEDKPGIDIIIKPGTKKESVHIPVVISQTGLNDLVYNDFHIGEDCDVTIVAGCGIHNSGDGLSQHDGIHEFFVGKNSKIRYIEKHYGQGDGKGGKVMNPKTIIHLDENAYFYMDTVQIKGIDSTMRETDADLKAGAKLEISEKLMTHGEQTAQTQFSVDLNGEEVVRTLYPVLLPAMILHSYSAQKSQEIMPVPVIVSVMRLSWIMQKSVQLGVRGK